jgi:hypothetical protein
MSRTTTTNAELYAIRADIEYMSSASPSYRLFFKEKISRFFNQNKMLLKIIDQRLADFIKQYAVHDEEGNPVTEKKEDQEHYTFKDEETKEQHKAAVKQFMERQITIEI